MLLGVNLRVEQRGDQGDLSNTKARACDRVLQLADAEGRRQRGETFRRHPIRNSHRPKPLYKLIAGAETLYPPRARQAFFVFVLAAMWNREPAAWPEVNNPSLVRSHHGFDTLPNQQC